MAKHRRRLVALLRTCKCSKSCKMGKIAIWSAGEGELPTPRGHIHLSRSTRLMSRCESSSRKVWIKRIWKAIRQLSTSDCQSQDPNWTAIRKTKLKATLRIRSRVCEIVRWIPINARWTSTTIGRGLSVP